MFSDSSLFSVLSPYQIVLHHTNYTPLTHTHHTPRQQRDTLVISSTMAVQPTWAQVARRKTPPAFLPTECAVNLEQFAAPLRLPPSSSRHSAFIPLPSAYKQGWALDIVTNIPNSAVGVVPRADISLLEVCFANQEAQQDFMSSPFECKHFKAHPVPPAGTPSIYVPIKLMNVPVLASLVVETQLRSFWATHGEVITIAPHTYKGTPIQLLGSCSQTPGW